MSKVIFKSNRIEYLKKHDQFVDILLQRASMDIEIGVKTGKTPVKTGELKAGVRHRKIAEGKYEIVVDADHAAVQEAGKRAGSREFTNYTTPGTGKGFFRAAINDTLKRKDELAQEAAKIARL